MNNLRVHWPDDVEVNRASETGTPATELKVFDPNATTAQINKALWANEDIGAMVAEMEDQTDVA